ncbi:hypothetical protein IB276_17750 [Ensifer sp. ENS04]|uniref:hypothetical protein n=1 Tax=Ensifer sp. ENS04 TaxID=2769281 RepID=UPI00177B8DC4|nr:hypothetical protein [Ensifer sp. ENS04]MBD9541303.1 hypothetical protein [Ensifer sp. ENS04]
MPGRFKEFLKKNSIVPSGELPLVHSTPAYRLESIISNDEIVPSKCDVFETPLTYFFVGRPAYKVSGSNGEAEYWELPACFIFEYTMVKVPDKVFPFDSGAFHHGRMPSYVSVMNRDEFDVHEIVDAPTKIIGAYFPDLAAYMKGQPKDTGTFQKEFTLGVFETEAKALHRLSLERHNSRVDDRRLSVELATSETFDLKIDRPLAVIAPDEYFADAQFSSKVTGDWGAVPISYPLSSLSTDQYYGLIYDRIETFYRDTLKII